MSVMHGSIKLYYKDINYGISFGIISSFFKRKKLLKERFTDMYIFAWMSCPAGNAMSWWPYIFLVICIFTVVTMWAVLVTQGCRKIKLQYYAFKLASAARLEFSPLVSSLVLVLRLRYCFFLCRCNYDCGKTWSILCCRLWHIYIIFDFLNNNLKLFDSDWAVKEPVWDESDLIKSSNLIKTLNSTCYEGLISN